MHAEQRVEAENRVLHQQLRIVQEEARLSKVSMIICCLGYYASASLPLIEGRVPRSCRWRAPHATHVAIPVDFCR